MKTTTLNTKIWASVLVLLLFLGCTTEPVVKTEKEPIKIGAILMLTGDLAMIGQEMQRGIELAVDDINARGGIDGRKIEVIYEDSGFINKEKIVTAAYKLIDIDKVDTVIIDTVNAAKPIAPLFQENKIPLIVVWDDTEFIDSSVSDYIVSIGFSTEKTGQKMATFAYTNLHKRKITIVAHYDEWAEIISDSFKEQFEALGGEIVLYEKVEMDESDFRTLIEKIKYNDVDSVYLAFVPLNIDVFLKQAKELGLDTTVLGGDTFTDDILAAAGSNAEGVYFTNIYVDDNPLLTKLQGQYTQKYGQDIISSLLPFASFGYDGVLVVEEAMKKAGEITPMGIKDALYTITNFHVSGGARVSITPQGTKPRIERIYLVEEGKVIPAE